MRIITTTQDLETLCAEFSDAPYITLDTEFLRERTYWPVLCLIQIARPTPPGAKPDENRDAAIIDPLSEGLDLAPLFALMREPNIVKVFHAGRQDLEIFHHLGDVIPAPLFDTQIAAMVCGYGDQIGYEPLARALAGAKIDKGSRFTDWSRRPLSEKQRLYALADVTHLRVIYEKLAAKLAQTGRAHWLEGEMSILTDPATYRADPAEAWRRLKIRNSAPEFVAVAQTLAEWREALAQERDVPRNRIMKDDVILELAGARPETMAALGKSRLLQREWRSGARADQLLEIIKKARAQKGRIPLPPEPQKLTPPESAMAELLRVLLKARAADLGVAPRVIASSAQIDSLALSETPADLPQLSGWRFEAFGDMALRLKKGEIALGGGAQGVRVIDINA